MALAQVQPKLPGALSLGGADRPHLRGVPAAVPALWRADAQVGDGVEGVDVEPNWDEAAQPAPDFEVDQRVSW